MSCDLRCIWGQFDENDISNRAEGMVDGSLTVGNLARPN
jgi:hypothetical protein